MSNNFDKFAILESFLDEVSSYLPEIQANLDRLQQEPSNSDVIEETYRRAHTIAGSAAMMEYSALARVAQGMEDILGDALDSQTPIDQPTIGLLRRSFGRLSRLIEHIRSGEDDALIVAEDDTDRAAWRGGSVASASGAQAGDFAVPANGAAAGAHEGDASGRDAASSTPLRIPDWLAAFAGPAGDQTGQEAAAAMDAAAPPSDYWMGPEGAGFRAGGSYAGQPANGQGFPYGSTPGLGAFQAPAPNARQQGAPEESFDDILRSFQANPADGFGSSAANAQSASAAGMSGNSPQATGPFGSSSAAYDVSGQGMSALPTMPPSGLPGSFAPSASASAPAPAYAPPPSSGALSRPGAAGSGALVPVLSELRADEEAVRRQVATLRDITVSLREAAQSMEDERLELRSFLDGSRDALERLEEWAGQQMGLDLRHSPDSVRRYLPLSVIWVTTTRLKQLVTLLKSSDRGLTSTQEQIEETLNELRSAIENTGHIYSTMSTIAGPPDAGFSATVAQFTWAPPAPPAPPAPSSVDAFGRSRADALSPASRAEIERDVREQLRRELEDEVRTEIAAEVRRDEEDRLRQELQIQVRRQLLSDLTPNLGASSLPMHAAGEVLPGMLLSSERAPKPVQVTSDQSPEALEVFREEAQEHLQTITTGIAQLETAPGDVSVLHSIRRAMHTLKGAAGMMGFSTIQQIAHASEDLLDRFVDEGASLTPTVMSLLLDTSEALDQLVSGAVSSPAEQQQLLRSLTGRYAQVMGTSGPDEAESDAATDLLVVDEVEEPVEIPTGGETTPDLSVRLQLSKLDDLVNLFGELLINRSILEERIDRLNRLVSDSVVVGERLRDVGGQLETRFEAATLPSGPGSSAVAGAGQQRDPAASWAGSLPRVISGGLQPTPEYAREFDELELDRYTEFHRLSRGLSEGVADAVTLSHEMETLIRECQTSFARENRLTSDFQDRLLKARLVPLQSLVPRLYRTARASALREGKEIEFYAEGMETEVDRKVYEELAGPLLHIVRNAVNHAIERPNARELEGKDRAGRILISAAYEGNQVVISVRDDGAGINPDKIRETAIARGWIDPYTTLSEKEALNLIFQPGVSTAETVTEESGRGVGLDVVRDTVSRLRGTVEVESSVGQGTIFTMKFPISLQIARAVLVRVGTQTLAIPMAVVDQIGRLDYYQKIPGPTPAVELRGERYPLAHLAGYLKFQQGPVDERSSVLLVNAGKRRMALLADAIVAQQEIVSKPLGPHLREVRGVAGAAVLGNGQVILILEMHELLAQQPRGTVVLPQPSGSTPHAAPAPAPSTPLASAEPPASAVAQMPTSPMPAYGSPASVPPKSPPTAATIIPAQQTVTQGPARRDFVVAQRPATGNLPNRTMVPPGVENSYVLVVDDSPSVRRVVSNMLKANGWEVQTARDGVEALEVIARQVPAAVLLDIEMPRMDGYELMATVRSQEHYRFLPLVVLTSRAATKHQQRALQLGADAYVVKPYQDEELLSTIATLVQARR